LKLNCDEPRSNFAFNFNLRRFTEACVAADDVLASWDWSDAEHAGKNGVWSLAKPVSLGMLFGGAKTAEGGEVMTVEEKTKAMKELLLST